MKRNSSIIFTILVFILLWAQARLPAWNSHMQVDIWVFWQRISYFVSHQYSFTGLMGNEILPTTLLYGLIPIGMAPQGALEYANFYLGMLIVNMGVLFLTWYLARDKRVILWLLICLGPLLLFRFDGLVALLLVAALLMFEKRRYAPSGFLLGLAIGMKVFPVILLPYLLIVLWSKKEIRNAIRLLIGVGEAMLLPLIIFAMLGGDWEQIKTALAFHNQKLISVESLPGSLITLREILTKGIPPTLLPGNGIWSVAGPVALFNKLWIVPVGLFYLFLISSKVLTKELNWRVTLAILLIFLTFSKNLNPQYLWWYMVLLPFSSSSSLIIFITGMVAVLNQLVFPLFYTTLINDFYQMNQDYWVFFLLLLRNVGVVTTMLLAIKEIRK